VPHPLLYNLLTNAFTSLRKQSFAWEKYQKFYKLSRGASEAVSLGTDKTMIPKVFVLLHRRRHRQLK
ncbi:MAG: hypothetical protein ACK53Y_27215, partial [bacterium]